MAKKEAGTAPSGEKVTVRANDEVIKKGGAYHDPDHKTNPKSIGKKPVEVVRTPFINQRLRAGDLEEVKKGGKEDEEK